ncbi:chalcone isomerase family protein [Sorangium sp. So ce1000]|uniref:chalcone isomerase family protein n=1 Tax=Sorangium sp. So ce1000 TaxID=3133325 RepID=UPI003F61E9D2
MHFARIQSPALLAAFAAIFLAVGSLFALPDYTLTGTGVRVRTIGVVNIDVYRISHYMEHLPATRSREAVIDMDTGKKFVWTMLRDVDRASIVKALREAYALNRYTDTAKIERFVAAFKGDLKAGAEVTIEYDPRAKATTVTAAGGEKATVGGVDFMKATWRIWLGKIDQPRLSDELIARLP